MTVKGTLRRVLLVAGSLIAVNAVLWGALLGSGVATIDDYNGTHGVSLTVWSHHYCSADVTIQGDVVASASCQPDGL